MADSPLDHQLFLKLMERSQYPNYRFFSQLFHEKQYSLEEVFYSLYDNTYIENLNKKEAFLDLIDQMQTMMTASSRIRISSKNKNSVFLMNPALMKQSLSLLLSSSQKRLLFDALHANHIKEEKEENKEETGHQQSIGQATLEFILQRVLFQDHEEDEESLQN